jgi:hypothetical protein
VWAFSGHDRIVLPGPAANAAVSIGPEPKPATTAPELVDPARVPVSPALPADWRLGLTEESRGSCLAMLEDEDTDVVLVQVMNTGTYSSFNGGRHREFRVQVLDGSEKLGLLRQEICEASWPLEEACRDVVVGEVFFAFVTNRYVLPKRFGMPPKMRSLRFACPALPGNIAVSTIAEAQAASAPAAQSRSVIQRWFEKLRAFGR